MTVLPNRTDQASSLIGGLLLRQYAMLPDTCPHCNCVLMQAPNRGRITCVLCGDQPDVHEEEQDDPVELIADENPGYASMPMSDSSELLSQRMLQGWSLLGTVCSQCHQVPLVKRNQVTECVTCGPLQEPTSARLMPNPPNGTPAIVVSSSTPGTSSGRTSASSPARTSAWVDTLNLVLIKKLDLAITALDSSILPSDIIQYVRVINDLIDLKNKTSL